MEIEKKFLIKSIPDNIESYPKKVIEQAYICTSPVIRIRRSNERFILTLKSRPDERIATQSDTCMSNEIEIEISADAYDHLKLKADGCIIQKVRYIIELREYGSEYEGLKAELDIFEGCLKGLVFAEVEFADPKQADDFIPPEWFGKNVSNDRRYSNSFLSGIKDISEFVKIFS